MKVEFAILKRQYDRYKEEYEEAVLRVLRSGWYIIGDELLEFEDVYAKYHCTKHCIGVNSGLDALVLALKAIGVGKGDEVIVQTNTFIATVLAITHSGATPIFADADDFFGLETTKLEDQITSNTKAIIPVHLYGQPCNMDIIIPFARKHNLFVIEDCAQAHGSTLNGKMVGTFGDIGCFSFYPMKPIGAFGDAGAIITNSDDIAEKLYMLRNYGSRIKYKHEIIGINTRLDEIQAAILKINLKYANEGVNERCMIADRYINEINNPFIILPKVRTNAKHVFHVFALRSVKRNQLHQYLRDNGIQTQIHYPIPCHLAPCYTYLGYTAEEFPVAKIYADEELSLPIYVGMPEEDISYVIKVINKFC